MQNQENYKNYTVQNFICDEFFQDCVLHPDRQKEDFWKNWTIENPAKRAAVEEAVLILKNLRFRNDHPVGGKAARSLEKAWQFIQLEETAQSSKITDSRHRLKRFLKVAAICIVLIGIGWVMAGLFKVSPAPIQVATNFGELDSVYLPDHSLVVINANSSIQYDKNWTKDEPREVWLKGEALFQVQHLNRGNPVKPHDRFVVHVGQTTVEVLGTSFDVRQRRGKTEVALLDGSIRLHFEDQDRPDLQMRPGELVVIDSLSSNVNQTRVNTDNYTVWTKKKLQLTNPTLQEIVRYLEDIYGKKIVLGDSGLATRRVEGPIMLDSLDDALFIISTVLNLKIIKQPDVLIIKSL